MMQLFDEPGKIGIQTAVFSRHFCNNEPA